jgi:phosphoribosylformimino-5-aminoimidazole carboxamide ribotide isomerase
MMVIPAVDLMDGKCVQLVEGKPWSAKVTIDDPVGMAIRWVEQGAKRLHIVDLDAALGSGSNEQVIKSILAKVKVPVQVGGGIRDDSKADRLLSAGAAQIVVGTRAVTDVDWLKSLVFTYPERVIVAVDARGSKISVKGWTNDTSINLIQYVKSIEDLKIFGLLYTNISVEGKLKGIDIKPIEKLAQSTKKKLFVAGGITTIDDIVSVSSAGAFAAILGMAIYKGKINLKEALERFG